MFLKLVSALKFAFLWHKALQRTSEGQFSAAMSYLARIYEARAEPMPSAMVRYYVNILTGQVACRLEDYELAAAAIRIALRQLGAQVSGVSAYNDGQVSGLSAYDKDYLRYHCKTILEYVSYKTHFRVFEESRQIDLSFNELQFDKVRPDLRRNFPVVEPVESEQLDRPNLQSR